MRNRSLFIPPKKLNLFVLWVSSLVGLDSPEYLFFFHFPIGIKLLGFKDRTELAFEDNIKHSQFVYPDEMVKIPRSYSINFLHS